MDIKRNEVTIARRRERRRALWCAAIIVICSLIAVLWFLTTGKNGHTQKDYVDEPVNVYACQPNLPLANDKQVADLTINEPGPNQPEQLVEPELLDMATDEIAKESDNILPVKIRKHRAELLETLSKESTLESIDNLPNFDDTRIKYTIPDALPYDSYEFMIQLIPMLSRIRKILEETEGNPNQEQIIAAMIQKLEYSIDSYGKVVLEHQKAMLAAGGSMRHTKPPEHRKRQTYSAATIYLFSELRAYKALPLLSKVYHYETKIPISRLYVFYSMHLLAMDHPRTGLSPQSETALDAYLEAASDLPKPYIYSFPTSKSAYHETDPRIWMKQQDILKNQPKKQLRIYPPSLAEFEKESWGTPQTDPHWLAVDPKIDELSKKLKVFVDATYPEN
jgi:hypothetical protein